MSTTDAQTDFVSKFETAVQRIEEATEQIAGGFLESRHVAAIANNLVNALREIRADYAILRGDVDMILHALRPQSEPTDAQSPPQPTENAGTPPTQ